MEKLTLDQFYSALALILALCTVVGFFLGKQSDAKKQGKCEGELETSLKKDIGFLTELVKELKGDINSLKNKMEEREKDNQQYHREQSIKIGQLESSYRSLHKRVDFLFNKLQLKEVYHDNHGDGFNEQENS